MTNFKQKVLCDFVCWQLLFLMAAFFLFSPKSVEAVCPVCTVAVGTGLGLSRYLKISDLITGFWIGAFILSASFWLKNWLEKKWKKITAVSWLALAASYLIVFLPLFWSGAIISHSTNRILGIDKLLLGSIIGTAIFYLTVMLDHKIKEKRGGKVLFYYQKVVFPLVFLIIASLIIFFLKI